MPLPDPALAAGLAKHPPAEWQDQARLHGERDELRRWNQAALRVLPAHQRLQADDPAVRQAHDRLIVHRELLALDGTAQFSLQREARHGAGVHTRVEHGPAGLAPILGGIHRHVGLAQQLGGTLPPGCGVG